MHYLRGVHTSVRNSRKKKTIPSFYPPLRLLYAMMIIPKSQDDSPPQKPLLFIVQQKARTTQMSLSHLIRSLRIFRYLIPPWTRHPTILINHNVIKQTPWITSLMNVVPRFINNIIDDASCFLRANIANIVALTASLNSASYFRHRFILVTEKEIYTYI